MEGSRTNKCVHKRAQNNDTNFELQIAKRLAEKIDQKFLHSRQTGYANLSTSVIIAYTKI